MKKTEIIESLSTQKAISLDEKIQELRDLQAGSLTQLAGQIEPLAQSMAALADDTRQAMNEIRRGAETQADIWDRQQITAFQNLKTVMNRMQDQAKDRTEIMTGMTEAAKSINQATHDRNFLTFILSGLMTIIILSNAYVIWQLHFLNPNPTEDKARLVWMEKVAVRLDIYLTNELYPNLNQKRREEIRLMYMELGLKPIEQPKPSETN